jgi:hypothetical protein
MNCPELLNAVSTNVDGLFDDGKYYRNTQQRKSRRLGNRSNIYVRQQDYRSAGVAVSYVP